MATQQMQFVETIRGMKLALKRKADGTSNSNSTIIFGPMPMPLLAASNSDV